MQSNRMKKDTWSGFEAAEVYDRSINWDARLGREIPLLADVFGPPAAGGIVDAGCGTGRQASALANDGYRVVGFDASADMLRVAQQTVNDAGAKVDFVQGDYAQLSEKIGDGFDGVFCLANALSAAGTADAVKKAIGEFGACLRVGGRFFVQVLNFAVMRLEAPCVRGPRVANVDGREYVSVRQFRFIDDYVEVTNVTLWHEEQWRQRAFCGRLYPITLDQFTQWCGEAGLDIDECWGSYAREAFDVDASSDLIVVGTRR